MAADAKGATIPATENSDNLATCIASIPSGGGGSGKYQRLERVKDDSNNEIGTVSGFFTDANDVEYAVVCLDAQYRDVASCQYLSSQTSVTDLPMYNNALTAFWHHEKETATFNTQKILDFASSSGYTSTACSFCRGKSFVIDGTTYYGQLPNVSELFDIVDNMAAINNVDTSASSYPNANFSSARTMWSSTQNATTKCYYIMTGGYVYWTQKTDYASTCPVIEIPNN